MASAFPCDLACRPRAPSPATSATDAVYTWTSDQFSQFGSKVISATSRDATYVLDEILDNETELEVLEHTTDTAGYTDLVFALFDLLGMRFAPRIRDSSATRLYRLEGAEPR